VFWSFDVSHMNFFVKKIDATTRGDPPFFAPLMPMKNTTNDY
jgi:hypothetical protein